MCMKIWSTFQVQCFSLTLLILYILMGSYWFLSSERKTNILCKKAQNDGKCLFVMNTIVITFLSGNIPGTFLLSISAALKNINLLICWLVVAMLQIPVAFFTSLWFLFWHQLMDPTPALIFSGLVLLYGCLLLVSWVAAYDLLFTIRLSREQHRVTSLVVVVMRI